MTDLEKIEVIEAITSLLVALIRSDWEGDIDDQGKLESIKPGELKLVLV